MREHVTASVMAVASPAGVSDAKAIMTAASQYSQPRNILCVGLVCQYLCIRSEHRVSVQNCAQDILGVNNCGKIGHLGLSFVFFFPDGLYV